jgi:hypothetical protein
MLVYSFTFRLITTHRAGGPFPEGPARTFGRPDRPQPCLARCCYSCKHHASEPPRLDGYDIAPGGGEPQATAPCVALQCYDRPEARKAPEARSEPRSQKSRIPSCLYLTNNRTATERGRFVSPSSSESFLLATCPGCAWVGVPVPVSSSGTVSRVARRPAPTACGLRHNISIVLIHLPCLPDGPPSVSSLSRSASVSVSLIQVGPLGHLIHVSTTTPVVGKAVVFIPPRLRARWITSPDLVRHRRLLLRQVSIQPVLVAPVNKFRGLHAACVPPPLLRIPSYWRRTGGRCPLEVAGVCDSLDRHRGATVARHAADLSRAWWAFLLLLLPMQTPGALAAGPGAFRAAAGVFGGRNTRRPRWRDVGVHGADATAAQKKWRGGEGGGR